MAFIKDKAKEVRIDGPLSDYIENFNFVPPGVVTLEILKPQQYNRTANLAQLVVLHGRCCWCNERDILPPKKRYCSDDCKESAFIYCNPQSPTSKGWQLLNRQGFSCACCGLSFEEEIRKRIQHYLKMFAQGYYKWSKGKVSLHYIANNMGHIFSADHIKPLFLGGFGLGLHNIQVLSSKCHETKTIKERQQLS